MIKAFLTVLYVRTYQLDLPFELLSSSSTLEINRESVKSNILQSYLPV